MSISCRDLASSFKEFKVKAIVKQPNGMIILSSSDKIEYLYGGWSYTAFAGMCIGKFEIEEFIGKKPEECIYIVKDYNKLKGKICWFWDDFEWNKFIAFLDEIDFNKPYPFKNSKGACFKNCRPVKPDEVEFVEEE